MHTQYFVVGLLVVLAICTAGCTQTAPAGTQTPTPHATQVVTAGPTPSAAPSATSTVGTTQSPATPALQTLPPGQDLAIQVNRDPLNRDLTVIFNGGRGQGAVRAMEVTVVRSDGTTETRPLDSRTGSEVVFRGTRGVDTVSVSARLTNGNTYRFFEQAVK
ncbi:MAG TPA: hypothetical protein PLI31_06410 [Methanoregulaceae archaeon]|nr:hypothetical protein [Methanoregulaceae archaeon]